MYLTAFSNLFIGKVIVRMSRGTQGRADGSKMPSTTFGSSFCSSIHGRRRWWPSHPGASSYAYIIAEIGNVYFKMLNFNTPAEFLKSLA